MAEAVKVAVRVRPFNGRERDRGAKLIIGMNGNTTTIKNPEDPEAEPRPFTFDYSYWSHDGGKELESGLFVAEGDEIPYADQNMVFADVGMGILNNAWEGFNCSLFAYGQTGSGKSYSVMGYGANKGVVPMVCDKLFSQIEERGADTQVSLSMLEIYNECVHDLLSTGKRLKGGMKVRNHPKKGFYVDGLVVTPVTSYNAIDNRINEGTSNRTVACTQMNATSSRAHTIVKIMFSQKVKSASGENMTKTASVNLVDLAGSERAESTGATGDRLKEGSAINQSLSSLGNVISALADQAKSKKKVMVPYRNSVLTMLLKNALAGNSKTIMCAALSPADINYEETLSTLRFADRAKQIKTKAVVNESPTEKLIRELREENARLMAAISGGGSPPEGGFPALPGQSAPSQEAQHNGKRTNLLAAAKIEKAKDEAAKQLRMQLEQNAKEMEAMQQSFEERLKSQKAKELVENEKNEERDRLKHTMPHLWNMSDDPALERMITHLIKDGTTTVGNRKADPKPDIVMGGMGLMKEHCKIVYGDGKMKISKLDKHAKLTINGKPKVQVGDDVPQFDLHHHDRLLLGANQLFCVEYPEEREKMKADGLDSVVPTYSDAQEEIAAASGITASSTGSDGSGDAKDMAAKALQDELVTMMPHVNEANAISQELDKKCFFEVVLTANHSVGESAVDANPDPNSTGAQAKVNVKVHDLVRGTSWLWSRSTFLNRKYLMQEMYQLFTDDEDWDRPQDEDPFWEPIQHQVIGSAFLYLSSLSHMIDVEETLALTDLQGREQGVLEAKIDLCDDRGVVLTEEVAEDMFVDEPEEMLGKAAHFLLTVINVKGIPKSSTGEVYCSFSFMMNKEVKTEPVSGQVNPIFNYAHHIDINKVDQEHLDYFSSKAIKIIVHAKRVPDPNPEASAMSTADLVNKHRMGGGGMEKARRRSMQMGLPPPIGEGKAAIKFAISDSEMEAKLSDSNAETHKLTQEAHMHKHRAAMLSTKLARIEKIIKAAEDAGKKTVECKALADALHPKAALRKFKGRVRMIMLGNRAKMLTGALGKAAKKIEQEADGDGKVAAPAGKDGDDESKACIVM